jgi:hypothetical protein
MHKGIHARKPRRWYEKSGIRTIIKNVLKSKQKPIAGKDHRGKSFIQPIHSKAYMERVAAIKEMITIALGICNPELDNAQDRPNNPNGMVANNDARDENDVSIRNNFNVCD